MNRASGTSDAAAVNGFAGSGDAEGSCVSLFAGTRRGELSTGAVSRGVSSDVSRDASREASCGVPAATR
jgi:hypothetical protein